MRALTIAIVILALSGALLCQIRDDTNTSRTNTTEVVRNVTANGNTTRTVNNSTSTLSNATDARPNTTETNSTRLNATSTEANTVNNITRTNLTETNSTRINTTNNNTTINNSTATSTTTNVTLTNATALLTNFTEANATIPANATILANTTRSNVTDLNITASNTTFNASEVFTDDLTKKYYNGNFLKTSPSLIPELSTNSSKCFSNVRSIVGYLSDLEQALLLKAARANRNSDRCFDCNVYLKGLPLAFQRQLDKIAEELGKKQRDKRESLKCLSFSGLNSLESNLRASIEEGLMSYLYILGETSRCRAQFISTAGQVLLQRRRFLCAKLVDQEAMAIKDANNYTVGFKWTDEEASIMSNAVVTLTQCVNRERSMLPQVVQNMLSTINLSTNCTAGRANNTFSGDVVILPTVPPTTNSSFVLNNNAVPAGRLLAGLRFLQDVNTTATNTTATNTTATNTTATNTTATNTTATNTTATNTTTPVTASPPNATTPITATALNATAPNATTLNATTPVTATAPNAAAVNATTNPPTIVATTPLVANTTNVVLPSNNVTNGRNITTNATIPPTTPFIIPVITTEPTSNRTLNASSTTNFTTPSTPTTVDFNASPILVPAIPAPIINYPNSTNSFIQLFTLTFNNTNMTSADIFPAKNNAINSNFTRTLLIGNTSTPVLIRNLLDFPKNDSDLYNSIVQSITTALQQKDSAFRTLAAIMNKGLLSDYEYNCLQGGAIAFLTNVRNSSNMVPEFFSTSCGVQENYTITITNGTSSCVNCKESVLVKNITFIDQTNLPSYYYFASSCLNGKKVAFGYWIDTTGIPLVHYQEGNNNLNKACLSKAFTCSKEVSRDAFCPMNNLNSQCRNEISQSCRKSGFYKMIEETMYFDKYDFVLPAPCNLANNNNNYTQMNSRCLSWVYSTFVTGAMNLNVNSTSDFDRIIYTTQTLGRLLQNEPTVVIATPQQALIIVPKASDPTWKDQFAASFANITIPNSQIIVDGIKISDNATVVLSDYFKAVKQPVVMTRPITTTQPNELPVKKASGDKLRASLIYMFCLMALTLFLA